jgi:hypothetical protein
MSADFFYAVCVQEPVTHIYVCFRAAHVRVCLQEPELFVLMYVFVHKSFCATPGRIYMVIVYFFGFFETVMFVSVVSIHVLNTETNGKIFFCLKPIFLFETYFFYSRTH